MAGSDERLICVKRGVHCMVYSSNNNDEQYKRPCKKQGLPLQGESQSSH